MARGLKRGRNRLVGMLVADLTNPYTVEVLQGVEAACHAYGYMPLICHAANEVGSGAALSAVADDVSGGRRDRERARRAGGLAADVRAGRHSGGAGGPRGRRSRRVIWSGSTIPRPFRMAVRHLAEQGFDELLFVVQPFERVSSRRVREGAFRDTIGAVGVSGATLVFDLVDDAAALAEIDSRVRAAASGWAGASRYSPPMRQWRCASRCI